MWRKEEGQKEEGWKERDEESEGMEVKKERFGGRGQKGKVQILGWAQKVSLELQLDFIRVNHITTS